MTDNELRVKIAEACGWACVRKVSGRTSEEDSYVGKRHIARYQEYSRELPLPDYPDDLNAMAEAEATLTESQREAYWRRLFLIVTDTNGSDWAWLVLHATARQRALAFVQTTSRPPQVPEGGQEGK